MILFISYTFIAIVFYYSLKMYFKYVRKDEWDGDDIENFRMNAIMWPFFYHFLSLLYQCLYFLKIRQNL